MAWEISHMTEAWDAARTNLDGWSRDRIVEALTDDAFECAEQNGQDGAAAADILRSMIEETDHTGRIQMVPHDVLVDMAIHTIGLHNTCTNGGHEFYIDREGYHTVPCSITAERLAEFGIEDDGKPVHLGPDSRF